MMPSLISARRTLVQRKCVCGGTPGPTGECEECRKKRSTLQTKLDVNEPGDIYEQEADRIANQVLTGPANALMSESPLRIQRLPGRSKEQSDAAPASVYQVLATSGGRLEPATRAFFEPRFGFDFSRVRIHTDVRAEEASRSIHARAFTAGNHIVFGGGQYAPQTDPGRSLLAHELAHIVQQNGLGPATPIQRQPAHGGENLALRDNINPEKWSEQLEAQYRIRGDTETADAIRDCRIKGLPACMRILTSSDVHVLYARNITPQPRSGSQPVSAKGNVSPVSGSQAAVGGAGMAAVALAPKLPPIPGGPNLALTPANENAVRTALSEVGAAEAEAVGTGTTLEVGVGTVGAEIAAGATVIAAIIVIAGVQLFLAGRYQEKLRAAGYILLEDPLKICIGGCHLPARPAPSLPDFTPFREPVPLRPFQGRQIPTGFSTGPTTFTPPVPVPQPKTKERRRRDKCKAPPGVSCPTWQPRLTTGNQYWNLAYQYRSANNLLERQHFNQNIAVLLLEGGTSIIERNSQGFHSEQLILWTLAERAIEAGCPILGLFSERKPCQEICQRLVLPQLCRVNSGVPFNVYFAIDYYNSPAGKKSENNRNELIKSYAQAGYFQGF
jgi:hypothetical protein